MIIHHTNSLHKSITNRRTDKGESTGFQVLRYCFREPGRSRYLFQGLPAVYHLLPIGELPEVAVKAAELGAYLQETPGVVNDALNLEPIPDNTLVYQQALEVLLPVSGYSVEIKLVKGLAVGRPLSENGNPAEAGLGAFQHQEFK